MIVGGHSIIYSTRPEADRAFLRDVLKFPNVDVGEGWLIFGLPPAELAIHPADENDVHEFYLMCDDVGAFIAEMRKHRVACDPAQDRGYGVFTQVTLPGGGKLGVYEPRHARPPALGERKSARRVSKRAATRPRGKTAATKPKKKR